ncbi:Transposase InsO and inactivated derivatives [Isobaculum melis]|uniref:Transposase InsO and inactivated derivatives n=2 Tax=Isobaculum melis TaxID=142588 RepID=A0A1H9U7P3_9LACT|nr:Transposase InsO and inactivated derivatives [Isobaculum melis]
MVNKIYGYRRMTLAINRSFGTVYNVKRIRRIMRRNGLYSVIRCTRSSWKKSKPSHVAENILNRAFHSAKAPNEIWCTDITEFKCKNGQKLYLSALIDLYDYSIVSYQISERNDNLLVMDTLHQAFKLNAQAHPIIHSDRGFQYTSHEYRRLSEKYQFKVSMSRVSKCLDNQPIESFWGTLKAESFYLNKFKKRESLIKEIHRYIIFYNEERFVQKYNGLTPIEYRYKAIV